MSKRFFEFYTLQRSGSHAVLNWLFNQFPEKVLYFNNARPLLDPVLHMRVPDDNLQNIERLRKFYDDIYSRPDLKQWEGNVLAVGFEDQVLRLGFLVPLETIEWFDYDNHYRIMILRDFYNWISSRIRLYEKRGRSLDYDVFIDRWKTYARNLGGHPIIHYDKWNSSKEYRDNLLSRLEIDPRNDDISFVPMSGGGSSFDSRKYQGMGDSMNTTIRWNYLLEDKFAALRTKIERDKDLIDLNNRHFGSVVPWL